MLYTMAPLEQHYDDGFAAIGDAFREAAKVLAKETSGKHFGWSHLPELYLLRHAVELYLKSGIVIIHRKLKISYGPEPYSSKKPMMLSSGEWKPLFRTHDLCALYAYWKRLITEHKDKLTALTKHKTDMTVPAEMDAWIDTIGAVDPNNDYFRYPISKHPQNDAGKSPFKEVCVEFVESRELMRAFIYDESTGKDVRQAALQAAETLNCYDAMFRCELTNGW